MEYLKTKYKNYNVIYNEVVRLSKNKENPDQYIYDKVGELMVSNPSDYKKVLADDSFVYKQYNDKIDIEIDRYVNPPEITEGGFECHACGSKKTYHYQLQTRSADEPMTTFITCAKCGKKWKE